MLIETIIAALVPVGIEGVKQAISHFTGGIKPTTVDEQIKLEESEVRRLEAISKLDNPYGTPSQWVIDLRASSRYIAAIGVIFGGLVSIYLPDTPKEIILIAFEAVSVVFGFLFGNRIVTNFRK